MDAFAAARARARHWRALALGKAGGSQNARDLVNAALKLADLSACAVAEDDANLCGSEAALDRDAKAIFLKSAIAGALANFEIAHELGHFWMDGEAASCDEDSFASFDEEALPFGAYRVEGYGPKQRRECQANVFARTFLLPEEAARDLYLAGESVSSIALRLELEERLVLEQLMRGTLLPPEAPPEAPSPPKPSPPLDDSQRAAAHASEGPLLLEAGPGTGKTRTLVARVEHLLEKEVDAKNILILTFSNKAAEELRERIALASPEAATQIWAGTFHAFGLELLRRYGDRIGFSEQVRPIDTNDSLGLLEQLLPELPLDHYLALHEPSQSLNDILKAISRAKDELVTAAGYKELGEAMPRESDEQLVARQKVIEIAEVYERYQTELGKRGVADFGDLIMRCCELLSGSDDVKADLQREYPHILVDEFQDVNRASAVFLRHLAGKGKGLWVVGDVRQSIYRFRGASPDNLVLFDADYEGAKRLALEVNYRSSPQIVGAFAKFGSGMAAGKGSFADWRAFSPPGAALDYNAADTFDAEADGIADLIRRHHANGTAFANQVILCRSHNMLARFAAALELRGIPALYLGDVFERPEIRDLLALLSVLGEAGSSGLVRAGRLPAYDIPLADLRALFAFAASTDSTQLEVVRNPPELDLSAKGLAGLASLRADLAGLSGSASASTILQSLLFYRRRLDPDLVADGSVAGAQKRLAIFQLLRAAASYAANEPRGGLAGFLAWVRRLELLGDERQLRAPPAAAGSIDAIRLLTVHASKGLEFDVVYLPAMATSYFPASARYDPCPPPPGLVARGPDEIRLEEEQCLFFVALSRAKRALHLSYVPNYGAKRNPSDFLFKLASILPRAPDAPPNWTNSAMAPTEMPPIVACATEREIHDAEDLDQYRKCGRSYLYQRILELSGGRKDNGYVRFHRAVYSVLRQIHSLVDATDPRLDAGLLLDEAWNRIGPVEHPYEDVYRRQADRLLDRAVDGYLRIARERTEWTIDVGTGLVRVRPDFVIDDQGVTAIRRLRTGRAPKTPPDDDIYALYLRGAEQTGRPGSAFVHYLGCDSLVPVPMTDRVVGNRVAKYGRSIDGIAAGRFPVSPDDRTCPRCPQYFVCTPGEI